MTRPRVPGLAVFLAALMLLVSAPLALADGSTGAGQDPPESTIGGGSTTGDAGEVSADGWTDWTVQIVNLLLQATAL